MDNTTSQSESRLSSHLLTVQQFCDRHPWPTEPALRSYIFRAKELGLSPAVIRIGRRILLDEPLFFQLIRTVSAETMQRPKRRGRPPYMVRT